MPWRSSRARFAGSAAGAGEPSARAFAGEQRSAAQPRAEEARILGQVLEHDRREPDAVVVELVAQGSLLATMLVPGERPRLIDEPATAEDRRGERRDVFARAGRAACAERRVEAAGSRQLLARNAMLLPDPNTPPQYGYSERSRARCSPMS